MKSENSKEEKLLELLPANALMKVGVKPEISSKDKVLLIRKANEFWQENNISAAEKIFFTLNYSDGLARLGDYYYNKGDFIKSLACFVQAKDHKRAELISEKIATVVRSWLEE